MEVCFRRILWQSHQSTSFNLNLFYHIMKRTFAKRSLMSLVAGFFLFGFLLLSAGRAEAQTLGAEHNWMGVDQAQQTLVATATTLYNELNTMQPGTQAHNNKLAHAMYYRLIHRKLGEGTYVGIATKEALELFSGKNDQGSLGTSIDVSGVAVDASLKQQLYNDAIDLLTL